ncbi:MAG: T9SS C-terminal target domain-containing protein [Ignavibacteriae bacterium]|nr:T9SS C-terminal target domain-containing protein [Ignavibacteriota bacterium]MCO6448614.1 T9SS type A sorting domain-containing protein [Ignavibacterium album]HOJ07624.1 T9SS type A sorting domain-containing protein [Ignavibacteriaceae bacterium]
MGRVRVYGVDSDNHWHSDYLDITIQNIQGNTTSGTLTHNETWCGVVNITGNITVPSNITLEILPNTNIYFQSSNNLTVYGTLVANSDAARKIDFMRTGSSGSWGSITFDGSGASNSILNYITVKNGLGIRCLNGANVTVTNSTIDHCTEGVYIYNSQPNISGNQIIEPVQNGINVNASGLSPLIQGNNITKSSSNPQYRQYQGIYLSNNSNGYIAKNDISGFYWGMYIGGGSDAYFTNYSNQSFTQNNRVINNRWGLGAGWGGYIFAGMWKSYGRNNSIYNNLNCDAYSYNSSNIIAQSNWWGNDGAQIYHDGTSTLDASLPLTYDPWIPQNNVLLEESELLGDESVNQIIIPDSSIILGILLEFRGRTNEAIFHYKQMIKNKRKADFAIGRLVSIMNRDNVIEIREFIESLLFGNNDYKPIVLTVLAGKLLEENKYEEAKILYNRIINDYPDSYFAINARFEKFFAALSIEHNLNTASELLNEIRALALNDVDYLIRLQDAENQFVLLGTQLIEKPLTKQQVITELGKPDSYALNANYPNPFNPSTNIQFSTPEQSFVELKVFDILGNEVANLVKQDMEPGNYSVVFNGSNLASGIYLYRLVSGNFFDTKKMMLIK